MDENALYKTAVVVAISEIPPMSVYHYTRDFPEFFSPTASQHKRGRRWTDQDVNMLMSIQSLYHDRKGKEKIRAAIAAGWRIGNQPIDSQEAAEVINKLLEIANQFRSEAEQFRNQAQIYMNKLNSYMQETAKDHGDLVNMKKALANQAEEINRLITRKRGLFG